MLLHLFIGGKQLCLILFNQVFSLKIYIFFFFHFNYDPEMFLIFVLCFTQSKLN